MSMSVSSSRSELLAEARHEWLALQQQKAVQQKAKPTVTQPPADAELIAQDAALRQKLANLESTTEQLVSTATRINLLG